MIFMEVEFYKIPLVRLKVLLRVFYKGLIFFEQATQKRIYLNLGQLAFFFLFPLYKPPAFFAKGSYIL